MTKPNATVTFNYSGNTATLPAPTPGYALNRERTQTRVQNASGAWFVYDKAITNRTVTLTFVMTATQKTAFETWYSTHAKGSYNTFTFTDHIRETHTARILNESLEFTKTVGAQYQLELTMYLSNEMS